MNPDPTAHTSAPEPKTNVPHCIHCGEPIFDNGTVYVHIRFDTIGGKMVKIHDQWCDSSKRTLAETQDWRMAPLPISETPRWTDQNLYDAYLCGCEDDCLPEPMSKTMFLAQFTGGK